MVDFGYVIVGAGTAGCVLASRLSEDPGNRVLVLEYGGHDTNPHAVCLGGFYFTLRGGRHSCHYPTRPIGPGGQLEASQPVQVAGNTQAPAMAVAWIAADLIREDS
jgi:choline dehydrogenase